VPIAKPNSGGNPFKVFTPEGMSAADTNELFVPVPDFNKIKDPGHAMLHGPRGSGKSMIFRHLLPDCQCLQLGVTLDKLPFFAALISIKNTTPNLTEFHRLDDAHAKLILNEHILTVFVTSNVFRWLTLSVPADGPDQADHAARFVRESFAPRLKYCGWTGSEIATPTTSAQAVFDNCREVCDTMYRSVNSYAKSLSFPGRTATPYQGPLCDYLGFLYPLLNDLRRLPFMPRGPVYLLVDDADYLSHAQTRILNSWVATRTQQDVSIKISTQLSYKTFSTVAGMPIQTPHDYQEICSADIYTSRRSKYPERIEQILAKRLVKAGITAGPRDFFPPDEEQEKAIRKIGDEIRNNWPNSGRGFRADDDVTRYARPEYIKRLGGSAKQTSKYSYAGFDQLAHISSGLVRFFLEPAAQMFDEESLANGGVPVQSIRPSIQDDIIRREAENLIFTEFDKIAKEDEAASLAGNDEGQSSEQSTSGKDDQRPIEKLRNLVRTLGNTFYQKLISDDAERRVFSVAISGMADPEVLAVFELGVRYGYFHRSSIGNKDGTGRTRLYVLTRRLAPHFNLDPSSFAGYLWVTSEVLLEGMVNPDRLLRRMKKAGVSELLEPSQKALFD
jgi:hypothetical protein